MKVQIDKTQEQNVIKNMIRAKILIIGEAQVGKSSFVKKYSSFEPQNENLEDYKQCFGANIGVKLFSFKFLKDQYSYAKHYKDKNYVVQFWDLAGDKNIRNSLNVFYKNSLDSFNAIFYFFDVSNYKSFQNFYHWINLIFKDSNSHLKGKIPIFIVGNKSDLCDINSPKFREIKAIFNEDVGENIAFINQVESEYNYNEIDKFIAQIFFNITYDEEFLNKFCINEQSIYYKLKTQQININYIFVLMKMWQIKMLEWLFLLKLKLFGNCFKNKSQKSIV